MLLVLQAEIVSVFGSLSSNVTVHSKFFLMRPAINVLRFILGIDNFLAAVQTIIS